MYNRIVSDAIKFEWDENKRAENVRKHGLDFPLAEYVLSDPKVATHIDNRKEYKEIRHLAYGLCFGDVLCLCYTMRQDVYRIISLRYTHDKERSKYYDNN
ncbi:hypothetical protein NO1_0269 [Candidatus Termititenax aidoneus]|uniref:Toxin BrnT n=1 Tax=Termititenax aidoneus TaxID=2218524 RepID=A0A388T8D9_TERA1|nr:hypothetical protein NO1_0269 [Candidatus Termititenax aidoneus]